MTKDSISDYSTTAGSNTDIDGINIDEGMSPSNVNNSLRSLMSHLAKINDGTHSLGTIKVDNLQLDANAITSTNTDGNITLTPNGAGLVSIAEGDLQIGSTTVTSTGAELNLMDGGTSAGTTAVAGGDGIVTNDGGTMRQTTVDTFDTYLSATTKTLTNKTISGASNTITAVPLTALDIDGGTATTTLADADLLIVDDGAGGTNRKITAANAKTYFGGGSAAPTALSGTSTAIDWSANSMFTHTLSGDTTYTFSNVSAGGAIELFLKNVGKPFDVLSQGTPDATENFSGQKGTERIKGSFFNSDGTKFYLAGEDGNYSIHQYALSSAYDVSTASYESKVSPSGYSDSTRIHGLHFNGDGSALIAARGNDLFEFALTSNYDISTVSNSATHSIVMDTPLGLNASADAYFVNIRFNSDGTLAYLQNMRHQDHSSYPNAKGAHIIKLSTAYDIDSTLTLMSSADFGLDSTRGYTNRTGEINGDISVDGTTVIVVEEGVDTSAAKFAVHKFFLKTPWDLSTESLTFVGTKLYSTVDSGATQVYNTKLTANGEHFYYNEYDAGDAANAITRIHNIQGDFGANFPSVMSSKPSTFGDGADPTTTTYARLVSVDGTNVLLTDHKEIL